VAVVVAASLSSLASLASLPEVLVIKAQVVPLLVRVKALSKYAMV
jgi:hypothetical protein